MKSLGQAWKPYFTQEGIVSLQGFHLMWRRMMDRCYNKRSKLYKKYGARGVSVSFDWQNFRNFKRDMWPCPNGFTIDRIDNGGNYSKSNCRWASDEQQAANRGPGWKKQMAREQLTAPAGWL